MEKVLEIKYQKIMEREKKMQSDKKSAKGKQSNQNASTERENAIESDEDVIDLCDDHDYQVLSAVLETEKGRNVAEILSKIQKDVHLLATSIHQLIQLSLAAQQSSRHDDSDDDDDDDDDGDDNDEDDDGEDEDN
jgi:hypothetical protein